MADPLGFSLGLAAAVAAILLLHFVSPVRAWNVHPRTDDTKWRIFFKLLPKVLFKLLDYATSPVSLLPDLLLHVFLGAAAYDYFLMWLAHDPPDEAIAQPDLQRREQEEAFMPWI